jgi:hypothetical protein
MAKIAASHSLRRQDFLPEALVSELRARAGERRSEILECLGQEARSDPDEAIGYVILAAARYRRFAQLYEEAPTRTALRHRLIAVLNALRTARELLDSEDTCLLAALSLGGWSEAEVRALQRGCASKVQETLHGLEKATHAALAALPLSGRAGGQKVMEGPKQRLVLDCAAIFEKYRPGEIREPKRRGAGFRDFVRIVHTVATGDPRERLRRAIREAREAVQDGRAIQPETSALAKAFDPLDEFRQQLTRLQRPSIS